MTGYPFRIGEGYDLHRVVENRRLVLGGVEIPWDRGLLGHSDADVLLHAIMNAVLGAAALGDIGYHFPDNDPSYEGADSAVLAKKTLTMIREAGYDIGNIDCTVESQKPKLMPYITDMRRCIAEIYEIDISQVNVKATTGEGLGIIGNSEAIAARAVCLLYRRSPSHEIKKGISI